MELNFENCDRLSTHEHAFLQAKFLKSQLTAKSTMLYHWRTDVCEFLWLFIHEYAFIQVGILEIYLNTKNQTPQRESAEEKWRSIDIMSQHTRTQY